MNTPCISALANHLWQSSVFAVVAWLLTLVLRRNLARVRHAIWMAASCKFLVPASVLIALGGQVRWRTAPEMAQSGLYVAVDQVSQPFRASAAVSRLALGRAPHASIPLAAILFGIWMCGFAGIAFSWWERWRRISRVVRAGVPLRLDVPVPAMSSPTLIEPGVDNKNIDRSPG